MDNNRILVLDDDKELLAAYRSILQPTKSKKSSLLAAFAETDEQPKDSRPVFEVTTATQGEEGVAFVKKSLDDNRPFAVAFIDIRMPPGIDGLEAAKKIRDLDNSIYIIIVTAYSDRSIEEIQRSVRHDVVLTRKPVSSDELIQQARNACNSWAKDLQLENKTHELDQVNKELFEKIQLFEKFVPTNFIKVLDSDVDNDHIQLGKYSEHEMSVMFSDIRSFTALSETITPKDNFRFINSYLGHMGPIVRKHHGFIDKFIGDGIMALFEDAENAINTAIEMMQRLNKYNDGRKRAGYVPISIGVGINRGPLSLGTIGEEDRMQTTVIGDTVNLAARTESLTKTYGAPIILTQGTFLGLENSSKFNYRILDRVQVKGKSDSVVMYEILDAFPENEIEKKMQIADIYQRGVELYYNKDINGATEQFQQCLGVCPEDIPTRIFLQRCWGMASSYETTF
ncbi:MAG: response regulator [Magnetococcales bacterium]|nr:response regulator [Magnetococcales bacterium]